MEWSTVFARARRCALPVRDVEPLRLAGSALGEGAGDTDVERDMFGEGGDGETAMRCALIPVPGTVRGDPLLVCALRELVTDNARDRGLRRHASLVMSGERLWVRSLPPSPRVRVALRGRRGAACILAASIGLGMLPFAKATGEPRLASSALPFSDHSSGPHGMESDCARVGDGTPSEECVEAWVIL
jgi:hypothetical protein